MKDEIQFPQETIRKLHGCESFHVQTVPVKEMFQDQTVWQGEVEVFTIENHPQASTCYAWAFRPTDDKPDLEAVTVLGIEPITSPQRAVQAYIASTVRRG